MNQNKNLILKIALLSTCLVSASLNAVTGLVPEMAAAFPTVSLSTIELIATVGPHAFSILLERHIYLPCADGCNHYQGENQQAENDFPFHRARIIETITKVVVSIISPFRRKWYTAGVATRGIIR